MTITPVGTTTGTTVRELQNQTGQINQANGWHNTTATPVERIALIITEAAEAIEEIRNGRNVDESYYSIDGEQVFKAVNGEHADWVAGNGEATYPGVTPKLEGVPSEIADIVIRCFDFAHIYGIDLEAVITEKLAYNTTRGTRHGGKKL